jgi:hypothetical protein
VVHAAVVGTPIGRPIGGRFPEPNRDAAVLARVVIRSNRERTVRMNFGLSDLGTVFLRGEPVYSVDNRSLSRSGRYLGIMTVDNDALYLPLERGDNELMIAVAETFGGWGLTARLEKLDGIEVVASAPASR